MSIELVMEQYARSAQYGEPDADLKLILDRTLAREWPRAASTTKPMAVSSATPRRRTGRDRRSRSFSKTTPLCSASTPAPTRYWATTNWKATAEKTLGYLTGTLKQENGRLG